MCCARAGAVPGGRFFSPNTYEGVAIAFNSSSFFGTANPF